MTSSSQVAQKHVEYQQLSKNQLTRNFIFAALCEVGEMANEWGHFKIWKSSRNENREAPCPKCHGFGILGTENCPYCENGKVNPLREEYVDVLHFVVSIALGLELEPEKVMDIEFHPTSKEESYEWFLTLYELLIKAKQHLDIVMERTIQQPLLDEEVEILNQQGQQIALELLTTFFYLGYSLGFADEEIEAAYFAKHQINHIRQQENY